MHVLPHNQARLMRPDRRLVRCPYPLVLARLDNRLRLAQRVTIPVLILGGAHDFSVPIEHQNQMFRAFGTPDEHKKQVVYEAGHWPLPMNDVIRETVGFLDRYAAAP